MTLVHIYDVFVFGLALSIPAIVVFRMRSWWLSLLFAACAAWLSIYAGGVVLTLFGVSSHTAAVDAAWLRTGWSASLIYAGLLFIIRFWTSYRKRRDKA